MPRKKEVKNIISLGGGLQSTAMLMMSLHGVIDRADAAIFADTGWERQATYNNIRQLQEYAEGFDFPIFIAHPKKGGVRNQAMNPDHDFIHMPVFTESPSGKHGQTKRQCTDHFKLRPIRKLINNVFGRVNFCQWIGISLDESLRMRKSDVKYITNRYPLIEMRWGRSQCAEWLSKNGFGIPTKSSCIGCPYHSNEVWLNLNEKEKADCIEVDEHIRDIHKGRTHRINPRKWHDEQIPLLNIEELDAKHDDPTKGLRQADMKLYLHQSRRPLKDVVENPADYPNELFPNMENEECRGLCFL